MSTRKFEKFEKFERSTVLAILAVLAPLALLADQSEIAKWDPNMAQKNAVVTNGVKWIDGRFLPLEGRVFNDTEAYYDRLPANVTTNVNGGVRSMKHHTSGMLFRFRTDSRKLTFKWVPYSSNLAMDHMPSTGVSGIDVYRFDAEKDRWFYVKTGRIWSKKGGSLSIPWTPGTPCIVNLPLYNGVKSFELGIDPGAKVEALGPRKSGVDRPVVFYGTSITHGGCCSRPGLGFVNWVGRDLDVPVVGLGFSGSGHMELEMSEHLARIDASCYVLDCLWNMNDKMVAANYEPFIRNLRAKRPDVPIVMAEHCNVYGNARDGNDVFIRKLYDRLVAEGWKKLVYLPNDEMYTGDYEGTVDGCHPNDLGMQSMKDAFGKAVRKALGLKGAAAKTLVVLEAHPGEFVACLGTAILARKAGYDVHVVDVTAGASAADAAACRQACDRAGFAWHGLGRKAGELFADRELCFDLADLFRTLKPDSVFTHWPIDVNIDRVQTGGAAFKALSLAGRQGAHPDTFVHYFELPGGTLNFKPLHYVYVNHALVEGAEVAKALGTLPKRYVDEKASALSGYTDCRGAVRSAADSTSLRAWECWPPPRRAEAFSSFDNYVYADTTRERYPLPIFAELSAERLEMNRKEVSK